MIGLLRFASAVVLLALTTVGPDLTVAQAPAGVSTDSDPFLWLEQAHGERAMAWVKGENAKTLAVIEKDPHYSALYNNTLSIYEATDRIPYPTMIGGQVYNFWQDEKHVRGIWRRTSPRDYATASPHWATVLDLDALAASEHKNWVWEGADCARPLETRCLISLSDGGEDAVTMREFDLTTKAFVKGGFAFPRGKQWGTWTDQNTVLIAREWSPGELTTSGYPYVIKQLKRGQPLSNATEIFRGKKSDVSVSAYTVHEADHSQATLITRATDFWHALTYVVTPKGLRQVSIPQKSSINGLVAGQFIVKLEENWNVGNGFAQGSVVSMPLASTLADPAHLHPSLVYAPGPLDTVEYVATTKDKLLIAGSHNVRAVLNTLTFTGKGWATRRLDLPDNSAYDVMGNSLRSNAVYVNVRTFLTPTTLYAVDAATGSVSPVKSLRPQFDASKDIAEQHEATSKDGTRIPYFIVHPKSMQYDGSNPTVLYAYGGFGDSITPFYAGTLGKNWLERGGVYVIANIRGGNEFGPAWHEAGLKTHRQRIYDDFYAVAQDLVTRKITTPRHLGIQGGSNGGLLMGVEFTQHPEMWNAVDIQVPLLDMLRYEKIEAGASWVGEYGSVSVPEERAFLASISPYNNLHAGTAYPQPLVWTTTKDDRVGPEHARKFAAMLAAMKIPYYFYEVIEGGHGSGANLKERAHTTALEWTYFTMKLMQ